MKKMEWGKYIIINKDIDGNVVDFEARPGADIEMVARDVVQYLFSHRLDKEYILTFNNIELKTN